MIVSKYFSNKNIKIRFISALKLSCYIEFPVLQQNIHMYIAVCVPQYNPG